MNTGSRLRMFIAFISLSLISTPARPNDFVKDHKHALERLRSEIRRLSLRRVYVKDFLDANGERTPTGVYFAATFSKELSEHASGFSVISRPDVHKYLDQSGWTDKDFSSSDVIAKFSSEFNPDAILNGKVSLLDGKYHFEFTAEDLTGKALLQFASQEKAEPMLRAKLSLPPTSNSTGRIYYFAGLDGVSIPEMIYAPNPSYSQKAREDKVSGIVVLSAIVTPEGRTDEIAVLRKLQPDLDAASVATLKTWRLRPCKDPDGTPIPVRVDFEVSFRLY